MSDGAFMPRRPYRQHLTDEQQRKLIKNYIRACEAYPRAIEEGRRDHEQLIALGLVTAEPDKSEQ